MKNLKKAKAILERLKGYDDKLLERTTGLSDTLSQLLESYITPAILEDLKQIDTLTLPKKKAFIDYLYKLINELESKIKPKEEKKQIEQLPLSDFFTKKLSSLNILKPIEKRAFKKVGVETVYDALFFTPKKYEDRRLKKLSQLKDGDTALLKLTVEDIKKIKKGKLKVKVVLRQGNVKINAYFVHDKPFLFTFFRKGKEVYLFGKVSKYGKEISMVQPQIFNEFDPIIMDRIVPVYSLRGDSSVKTTSQTINHLRRGVYKTLKEFLPAFPEYIPQEILNRYNLYPIKKAIKEIHFPPEDESIQTLERFETKAQTRVIFDELFILELAQSYRKALIKQNPAPVIQTPTDFIQKFQSVLPFELTEDQKKALKDILTDISKPYPMNRMVQGDVGSGKTMVAVGSALAVALAGKQVAVMTPTEILSQQHYINFKKILEKFNIPVYLLTGSLSTKEKREIHQKIKTGEAKVVIGTHALIQEGVEFKELAMVIVDEQHRFGVEQRKALMEKSKQMPHTLVMTATPIPRTLTLALYGDLDVSIIRQMPKGRKPVKTFIYYERERRFVFDTVRKELDKGRQAFVVYPLIEETEKMDLKSAEEGFKLWSEAFPDKKVLLLHGKMSQEEKDEIMEKFKNREGDILVSTTVIEVGIDIPNATVMVIEEAYRFGLSQIHQLRGRVGRGQYEGYCFLMLPDKFLYNLQDPEEEKKRKKTLERLKILVKTTDGFEIAEADLKLRGGGDIAGTSQSGKFMFQVADFSRERDKKILEVAKKEAERLMAEDPFLGRHPSLKELVFRKYADRLNLINVA